MPCHAMPCVREGDVPTVCVFGGVEVMSNGSEKNGRMKRRSRLLHLLEPGILRGAI
jgi:hypothetical protein